MLLAHLPPVEVEEVALLHLRTLEDEEEVVLSLGCRCQGSGEFLVLEVGVRYIQCTDLRTVDVIDMKFDATTVHAG